MGWTWRGGGEAIISDLTEMFWFSHMVWNSIWLGFGHFDHLMMVVLTKDCLEPSLVCVCCAYTFYFLFVYLPSESKCSNVRPLLGNPVLPHFRVLHSLLGATLWKLCEAHVKTMWNFVWCEIPCEISCEEKSAFIQEICHVKSCVKFFECFVNKSGIWTKHVKQPVKHILTVRSSLLPRELLCENICELHRCCYGHKRLCMVCF